jgi:hypothetical protein
MKISRLIFTAILLTSLTTISYSQVESQYEKISKLHQEIETLKDETKPGKSKFLLRGYAHAGLFTNEEEFTFEGGSFNPIFLYKQSDRLMFESELEFELENNELEIGLEYANIAYLLSKSLTLRVGKFLTPFGIYVPRLHPAWINKFGSHPLGMGHDGLLPTSDIGIDLRGSSYLGIFKVNYSIYVVNGPQLNEGDDEPEEAGMLHYGNFPDNNRNKTIGGRIGIFPFTNSSLEIGLSGMYGKVGSKDSEYENIASELYAVDITYVKNLNFMKSIVDLKGQYSITNTDKAEYYIAESDSTKEVYTFDNQSSTYFIQLSLRPALLQNKILRNFEVATRYSNQKTPEGSLWESDINQWEFGLNYWLDWRTVFKVTYTMIDGTIGHGDDDHGEGAGELGNTLYLHWAIGF